MEARTLLADRLVDVGPTANSLRSEVLKGLQKPQKQLPCKLFYDSRGAELFEQICAVKEYYPTRTELAIMQEHVADMAALLGPGCLLVEYGSGAGTKTRLLLDQLQRPAGYVPIDVAREQLVDVSASLSERYPDLQVLPVCADYTASFELPWPSRFVTRRAAYFPGSTIGNFHPDEARGFLQRMAATCGQGGALLIGVDLRKDPLVLHRAYNDHADVTAEFNLNMLARLNRELGAQFDLARFAHYAFYNPTESRVEMHLVSLDDQTVQIDDVDIGFGRGESIWTECSYKYTPATFGQLAASAGWRVQQIWCDPQEFFSVQYLTVG